MMLTMAGLMLVTSLVPQITGSDQLPASSDDAVIHRPITLDARELDSHAALKAIAAQAGLTLVIARDVRGSLTLRVDRATLKDVMTAFCSAVDCEWALSDGAPPTLVVLPVGAYDQAKRRTVVRVCTLGEDGRILVVDVGEANAPSVLRSKGGVVRIWKCESDDASAEPKTDP